jgi:hypothetical protein
MNKSLTGGVILAALTWALQANSVQAAPVCTADPAAEDGAEVLSVDVETVGDTQSVCASFADGLGSGFELSFSGPDNENLFIDDLNDPRSNLMGFSLSIRFVEFDGPEILQFDNLTEGDVTTFLWEVDETGRRLQALEVVSENEVVFNDPDDPSSELLDISYGFDDVDGSFVRFSYDLFCSDTDFGSGCADNSEFYFAFFDPVAVDNATTGGGDNNTAVPAPASLLLMAAGLGLLRRRRAPFRQRAA